MLGDLTVSMLTPANKDKQAMDITAIEQDKQSLVTYQA